MVGDAPEAVPYRVMPAYRAARDLWHGLAILRERLPDERQGHLPVRAMEERAVRIVIATAEGGARAELWRRRFFYQSAWLQTHDLQHQLERAGPEGLLHPLGRLGIDALFRMAQQAITIAAGAISDREEKARPGSREERMRRRDGWRRRREDPKGRRGAS